MGLSDGEDQKGDFGMRRDEVIRRLRELRGMKAAVEQMERALEMLTEDEREIIDKIYVNPMRYANEKLCEMLLVEVPTIYRRRNKALKKLDFFLEQMQ